MPDTNINNTNSVAFSAIGYTDTNFDVNPHFADIFCPIDVNISNTNITRDLPLQALTDYGNGLTEIADLQAQLNFDDYDETDERLIEPYVDENKFGPDNPFFTEDSEVSNVSLQDEVFNVEITNLPHRTYNGTNRTIDKTIYQLPIETTSKIIHNLKITEHSPASKVWIPLNNAREIPMNQLDVQISKEDGKKADNLQQDTHISIQIEQKEDRL